MAWSWFLIGFIKGAWGIAHGKNALSAKHVDLYYHYISLYHSPDFLAVALTCGVSWLIAAGYPRVYVSELPKALTPQTRHTGCKASRTQFRGSTYARCDWNANNLRACLAELKKIVEEEGSVIEDAKETHDFGQRGNRRTNSCRTRGAYALHRRAEEKLSWTEWKARIWRKSLSEKLQVFSFTNDAHSSLITAIVAFHSGV